MVARPPLRVIVEPMRLEDVPAVHAIELASFPVPWPPHAYRSELGSYYGDGGEGWRAP